MAPVVCLCQGSQVGVVCLADLWISSPFHPSVLFSILSSLCTSSVAHLVFCFPLQFSGHVLSMLTLLPQLRVLSRFIVAYLF